jgi:hypothetical protein
MHKYVVRLPSICQLSSIHSCSGTRGSVRLKPVRIALVYTHPDRSRPCLWIYGATPNTDCSSSRRSGFPVLHSEMHFLLQPGRIVLIHRPREVVGAAPTGNGGDDNDNDGSSTTAMTRATVAAAMVSVPAFRSCPPGIMVSSGAGSGLPLSVQGRSSAAAATVVCLRKSCGVHWIYEFWSKCTSCVRWRPTGTWVQRGHG